MTRPRRQESAPKQVAAAVNQGWVSGGSFLGSIISGTLLGLLADNWLGTSPWLVITGVLLGSYAGFLRLWHYSRNMMENTRNR